MAQYPKRVTNWKSDYKLLSFTFPEESDHINRKYKIMIRYLNSEGK